MVLHTDRSYEEELDQLRQKILMMGAKVEATIANAVKALTERDDEWTIHLPPGMKIVRSAQPTQLDTPFGRFSVAFEEGAGKVVVRTTLAFKKSRVTPAEYPAWRMFCEAVDRAFGQQIVVSK